MAQPVLVRAYTGTRSPRDRTSSNRTTQAEALPPIASYAFVDILRSVDGPEFQSAIDGIAEICAKNRMSLADEYASHLPPLGEITAATSSAIRPHLIRPGGGMRRALTSVPEGSSGSSESSQHSKKRAGIFSFRKKQTIDTGAVRRMRIGSMGRTVSAETTTAVTRGASFLAECVRTSSEGTITTPMVAASTELQRTSSTAESSLNRLLTASRQTSNG